MRDEPSTAAAVEGSFVMGGDGFVLEMPGIRNTKIAARVGVNVLGYRAWVALIYRELTVGYT